MPVKLDIPGIRQEIWLRVHERGDACVSREIRDNGIWEPYETGLLLKYLRPGGVFVDIGANIGYYTVLGAVVAGRTGLVAAYEPDKENFALLQENLKINHIANAVVFPFAVSDYQGSADIYLCEENRGDHRLYDSGDDRSRLRAAVVNGGEHIQTITRRVDFIKIDTQGSEFHIVNGLQEVIRANRDHLVMVMEFWPYGLRLAESSGDQLLNLLGSFDMSLYVIDHIGHRLLPVDCDCLRDWTHRTDADPTNQGFMNVLLLPTSMIPDGQEELSCVLSHG